MICKLPLIQISASFFMLFIVATECFSQKEIDEKFGEITHTNFDIKSDLLDSNTNAITLFDIGNSTMIAKSVNESFGLVFTEHKRIKIVNKNGLDIATVEIPLYTDGLNIERVEELKASTFNIENGKLVETKLDKQSIFTEKKNKHWEIKKFTFPAAKEGSIIEYSYSVVSDFLFNLRSWQFQDSYPCIWSEYSIDIPEFFSYAKMAQGSQDFIINTQTQSSENYRFRSESYQDWRMSVKAENYTMRGLLYTSKWAMQDVPALKEEVYCSTVQNYVSKISFQLYEIAYPNSSPRSVIRNWKELNDELNSSQNFGIDLDKSNNWLKEEISALNIIKNSQLDKAKAIFSHVRDIYSCTNQNGIFLTDDLKRIDANKKGSVADINLLLIAMLRHEKIIADPVILSTRSNGFANDLYPQLDNYNYVIALVKIDNNNYYLDASDKHMGFNKIPFKCYNGISHIIGRENSILNLSPDSINELTIKMLTLSIDYDKNISGILRTHYGYYKSTEIRDVLLSVSESDFFNKLKNELPPEVKCNETRFENLKIYDQPIDIEQDISLNSFKDDIVYFNPLFFVTNRKNPFSSSDRLYPVEIPFLINEVYVVRMQIPRGFVVKEKPESGKAQVNEGDATFEYLIDLDQNYLQVRYKLTFTKSTFDPDDYQVLRDFFSFVIKKESELIVFEKK